MDNDLPLAKLTRFKQLTKKPFLTIDRAMDRLSEGDLTEHRVREMMEEVQNSAHELGYAEGIGWL